ncbi:hypothetical protein [Oceanobacillus kimchii]|uniref:hypothetical protein n=1 Tax=Oceanobacillus kimchii TaxID=746691 RepID=UPI00034AE1C0|nr:hypothetical protein [Oceanobacillus kimchii]
MEKVKVTKEQAEEIEDIKEGGKQQVDYAIAIHPYNKRPDLKIAQMSTGDFARALLIENGYEIESEFKKGDYVMVKWKDRQEEGFYRVVEILPIGSIQIETLDGAPNTSGHGNTRHATPEEIKQEKERRWWAKHGREVWELRENDALYDKGHSYSPVVERVLEFSEGTTVYFKDGNWESYENVKDQYKVSCFEKDRLDLSN